MNNPEHKQFELMQSPPEARNNPTPEHEVTPKGRYEVRVDEMIASFTELDHDSIVASMDGFVSSIYTDAEEYRIKGSKGNYYLPEDLDIQFNLFLGVLNEEPDHRLAGIAPENHIDALIRVPSAGGLRKSFDTLLSTRSGRGLLEYSLERRLFPDEPVVEQSEASPELVENEIATYWDLVASLSPEAKSQLGL